MNYECIYLGLPYRDFLLFTAFLTTRNRFAFFLGTDPSTTIQITAMSVLDIFFSWRAHVQRLSRYQQFKQYIIIFQVYV